MSMETVYRPWGNYTVMWNDLSDSKPQFQVKRLEIYPGQALSLQSHDNREEYWTVIRGAGEIITGAYHSGFKHEQAHPGTQVVIPKRVLHRVRNTGLDDLVILEAQLGKIDEKDITRYEDMYGRA